MPAASCHSRGIEPHAHIAAPIMGFPGMETAPPEQVTRAALFGGTTTLVDFAIQRPGNDIFQERHGRWKGRLTPITRITLCCSQTSPARPWHKSKRALRKASFKIFTNNIRR